MMPSRCARALLCSLALLLGATGCNLLNTTDSESVPGRGAKAFDPYSGPASGAIRLDLQMVNGCTILPTGEPVGKGSPNFPLPYPASCQWPDGVMPPVAPPPPLEVLTGTTYFLDELTLMEYVLNQHTNPADLSDFVKWMTQQTRFKSLDWTGLGVTLDEWSPFDDTFSPGYFRHRVTFGNAAWMNASDDTFQLDVLDTDGNVRQTITYARSDLLAANAVNGHTVFAWSLDNVGAPQFPSDNGINQPPPPPAGYPPASPITFRSVARFSVRGATHPNKTFEIPAGLKGDGAIRVTWSLQPDEPYYFPIHFVNPSDLPLNCYSGQNPTQKVACTFGLQPVATMSPPQNGQFYQPGESFQVTLAVKDGAGNYVHAPDHFPSWNETMLNEANGMMYLNFYHLLTLLERDTASGFNIVGPRQLMRPYYDLFSSPYYQSPSEGFIPEGASYGQVGMDQIIPGAVAAGAIPEGADAHPTTTFNFTLPADAKPGTYNFNWKVHRHFLGERTSKLEVFGFQVGQPEQTSYPGRVGNCQICHRGVLSLDNLDHGGSVDHVENCKACHTRDVFVEGRSNTLSFIHKLHMNSPKYPLQKNDCTVCHLTRESAVRPSYMVCGSCHPAPHDPQYFQLLVTPDDIPGGVATVYSNCAQQCHVNTPPTKHILPQE